MSGIRRLLVGLLATLLHFSALQQVVQAQVPPNHFAKLYKKVATSTVHITDGIKQVRGGGSGVILHEDGYIATAAHVVETADEIGIEFINGEKTQAVVVTLSRSQDLALLKVAKIPAGFHIATLADSNKLNIGEDIFCIGSPRGLRFSLSTGIISAVRRDVGNVYEIHSPVDVIQTDAAINPGNSGGAMFNMHGEVIGLAAKVIHDENDGKSVNSTGLGLAIPSNILRKRLFDDGLPYIGVLLNRITPRLAEVMNWPAQECLLVERVQGGSLADKAGLLGGKYQGSVAGIPLTLGGDLIYRVGGHPVSDFKSVHKYLHDLKEGDKVEYKVWRAGRYLTVEVPLAAIVPIPKIEDLKGDPIAGDVPDEDALPATPAEAPPPPATDDDAPSETEKSKSKAKPALPR